MARRRRVDKDLKERRERKYRLRGRTSRFIPDKDSDFAHMARTFALHVAREAARFPLSAAQVEQLSSAVEAFRTALARSLQPDSAGPRATRLKKEARAKAEQIVRAVARVLRADESLTSIDRICLNLSERPKRLKRRACPQIAPILKFKGTTQPDWAGPNGGRHILEYTNDFDRLSGARPHGAARLELFVELVPPEFAAMGKVPTQPGQLSGGRLWYLRSYSTSRFEVDFPVMADGTPMLVVYWGRWADAKGNVGPFSKTCVARIESGSGRRMMLPGMTASQCVETKVLVVEPLALPEARGHDGFNVIDAMRALPALSTVEG